MDNTKVKAAAKAFDKWHKVRRHIDREHARMAWDAGCYYASVACARAAQKGSIL